MSVAHPEKPVGTRWRFTTKHQFACDRDGEPCTIVQHNGVGPYEYGIQFNDGKLLVAVERELQPLEEAK